MSTASGEEREQATLVGRLAELRQLDSAFEAATAGHGSLVMLVGEPGIGKTALCQRFADSVNRHAGRALIGHCYQEGSANLPYQPFVEAFEAYARHQDATSLRMQLGQHANEIVRIVPAIQDQLQVQPSASENPEDDRRRLFAGVQAFLTSAGDQQALMIVLEDLHDADRGTLDLLGYLARHVSRTRLLLLGTYRDVEVDRAHPLSAALADLRRTRQFDRIQLKGLSENEVQRLLGAASGNAVPRPLAELLHRRTDGNPLFVHELLRLLIAENVIELRAGALRLVGAPGRAGRMPEGLRDVVSARVSRLSTDANRVLSIASVIGRDFGVNVLRRVAGGGDDEFEDALEEAVAATIVEERSVVGGKITYRFMHAFFHQTLYEETIAPRRIRLHQQIARVLEEEYAPRLDDHATELAEHYAFSSNPADLATAVRYAQLAARRASAVFAYGEAVRQLERALTIQEIVDRDDDGRHCDLLLDLGEALGLAGDTERAVTYAASEALALAVLVGDGHRAFRACRLAIEASDASAASSATLSPEFLTWAQRAARFAEPGTVEQARANLALAQAWVMRGRLEEGRALRTETLTLAQQLGDPETLFESTRALIATFGSTAPGYWQQRLQLAKECVEWSRQGVSGRTLGQVLWHAGRIALADGDRTRAVELWNELSKLAAQTRLGSIELFVLEGNAVCAVLDGRLEEAWSLAESYVDHGDEVGASRRAREISFYLFHALAEYLGRAEAWFARLEEYGASGVNLAGHPLPIAYRAISLARLGRMDEARALAGPLLDLERDRLGKDPRDTNWLAILLECAIVLGHHDAARVLARSLVPISILCTADWILTTVARQLAVSAASQGDRDASRGYCEQALEAAAKIRFRPETALVHVQLAELLLCDGDQSGALHHLEMAIPGLEEMHMRPWLARALELRQCARESVASVADDVLTRREREVARLLAGGLTNREIAEALVITESTARVHVKHILSKLGFHSRSQVVGWAIQQDIARG